jgi:hypothetical protein
MRSPTQGALEGMGVGIGQAGDDQPVETVGLGRRRLGAGSDGFDAPA